MFMCIKVNVSTKTITTCFNSSTNKYTHKHLWYISSQPIIVIKSHSSIYQVWMFVQVAVYYFKHVINDVSHHITVSYGMLDVFVWMVLCSVIPDDTCFVNLGHYHTSFIPPHMHAMYRKWRVVVWLRPVHILV